MPPVKNVNFEINEDQFRKLQNVFDFYDKKEVDRIQVIEKILDIIILKK